MAVLPETKNGPSEVVEQVMFKRCGRDEATYKNVRYV